MLSPGDSQRVAELMRETAAAELLPRFRNLSKEDIRHKRPGDVVTVADVASEQRLAAGLARILPGVPVVGEEAVEKDPGLLDLIGRPGETCWIVDPLDGTANFAAGKDRFAMIICLVHDRLAVGGWILDVPRGRMAVAQKGQGVTLDGTPVHGTPPDAAADRLRRLQGPQGVRSPAAGGRAPAARARVDPALRRHRVSGDPVRPGGLQPLSQDQAVGPCRRRADARGGGRRGRALRRPALCAGQPINAGLIAAAHPQTLAQVRALFEAVQLPLLAALPKA